MIRRNLWTVFGALLIAALFLAGCGSDGDMGVPGPAGPPGDPGEVPTAEEVAEALLDDDDAVEILAGPEGEAGEMGPPGEPGEPGVDAGVQDVVDTLAMTPTERMMTAMGGTAPEGSKADVAKMQADIIKGLKGTAVPAAWYNATTIIADDNDGMPLGVVAGAMGLSGGDVGFELAKDGPAPPNAGPDGQVDDVPGSDPSGGGYDIAALLVDLNARRVTAEQVSAMDALDALPERADDLNVQMFNAILNAISVPAKATPGPVTTGTPSSLLQVTWADVQQAFRDNVEWPYDINFLLNNYFDSGDEPDNTGLFGHLFDMYRMPGTAGPGSQYDTNGDGVMDFTHLQLESVLRGQGAVFANVAALVADNTPRNLTGDIPDAGVTVAGTITGPTLTAIYRFILDGLIMGVANEIGPATPGTPGTAGTRDNYPHGADSTDMPDRTHLDTLTLVPVLDVDGVSLVKYTIDSALGVDADGNPETDGYYRLEAYGAWLEDSYFAVHTYSAVTEYGNILQDPKYGKSTVVHFAGGSPASLAGLGESATWTGAMVGYDAKSTADDPRVQGNATLNAHISTGTLQQADADGVAVMDVMFNNITDAEGMAARVTELSWTGLELSDRQYDDHGHITRAAGFIKSNGEIEGWLFNDGNEVVGKFNHMDIVGAYGVTLAE